jgi:hypothetical protein
MQKKLPATYQQHALRRCTRKGHLSGISQLAAMEIDWKKSNDVTCVIFSM